MSEGNGFATADAWLGDFSRRYDEFVTPAGNKVRIRNLTEGEKSKVDASAIDYRKQRIVRNKAMQQRARYMVACMVDGSGSPIFQESDVDRIANNMDSREADFIYRRILQHIGGEVEDIEELVGNSE